jgi:hypothetical protein
MPLALDDMCYTYYLMPNHLSQCKVSYISRILNLASFFQSIGSNPLFAMQGQQYFTNRYLYVTFQAKRPLSLIFGGES